MHLVKKKRKKKEEKKYTTIDRRAMFVVVSYFVMPRLVLIAVIDLFGMSVSFARLGENFRCVLFVYGRRREGERCVDRESIFFFFIPILFLSYLLLHACTKIRRIFDRYVSIR